MNLLAIDFGTKNIGLAYSVSDIISPLPSIKNDLKLSAKLQDIIAKYSIEKIYVGLSEAKIANLTLKFVAKLKTVLNLPIETVEEDVSTIEATEIYHQNRKKQKNYHQQIDSVSAAVILRRVISFS